MAARPTSFESWEKSVPPTIRKSPLWKYVAYPKVLFLYELVWFDCEKLDKDRRGRAIEEQIIRGAGSMGANIEEGYGRGLGRDYAFPRLCARVGAGNAGLVFSRAVFAQRESAGTSPRVAQ